MLWTHPYRIVRGGLRWTIWSSWGKSYKPVTLVLMFMALMFWKEFSIDVWQWQCLSHFSLLRLFQHVLPLHTQPPPFPPDLLPHLPDVREVWEEPGGVCVPQGPLFLLNCRETPHVLKNTSTHTHTHASCGKYSGCVITYFLEMFDFIPAVSVQTSVTGYICLNFMQLADFQIGLEKWLGFVCHLKCMV